MNVDDIKYSSSSGSGIIEHRSNHSTVQSTPGRSTTRSADGGDYDRNNSKVLSARYIVAVLRRSRIEASQVNNNNSGGDCEKRTWCSVLSNSPECGLVLCADGEVEERFSSVSFQPSTSLVVGRAVETAAL